MFVFVGKGDTEATSWRLVLKIDSSDSSLVFQCESDIALVDPASSAALYYYDH